MFLLVVAVFAQTIHYTVAIKRLNPNRVCAAILTSVWQFPLHRASFALAALECKIIIRKRKTTGAALLLLFLLVKAVLALVALVVTIQLDGAVLALPCADILLLVHLLAVTAAITATVAANTDA